jgi:hypothetical protein
LIRYAFHFNYLQGVCSIFDCISKKRGILQLSSKDKAKIVGIKAPSSRDLNRQPSLLTKLLKLSISPLKLETRVVPIFSDSPSNYIDLLTTFLSPQDSSTSMLHLAMESALIAQAKFVPKKSYNLDVFDFEQSRKIVKDKQTKTGKKEVSVVADLFALRGESGEIASFVLRVGDADLTLDMDAIDDLCGGSDGRDLFFKRNKHRVKRVLETPSKFFARVNKHGLKTKCERIISISARKEVIAMRNFQNTAAEFAFQQEQKTHVEVGKYQKAKFRKRLDPWEVFRSASYSAVDSNARGLFDSLTIL